MICTCFVFHCFTYLWVLQNFWCCVWSVLLQLCECIIILVPPWFVLVLFLFVSLFLLIYECFKTFGAAYDKFPGFVLVLFFYFVSLFYLFMSVSKILTMCIACVASTLCVCRALSWFQISRICACFVLVLFFLFCEFVLLLHEVCIVSEPKQIRFWNCDLIQLLKENKLTLCHASSVEITVWQTVGHWLQDKL